MRDGKCDPVFVLNLSYPARGPTIVIGGSFNILMPPGTVKSTTRNSVIGAVIVLGFSSCFFKGNKYA